MSKFIDAANKQYSFDHCVTSGDVSKQLRKNIERFGYSTLPVDVWLRTNFDHVKFAKSIRMDYQVTSHGVGFLQLQNELKFGDSLPVKKRKNSKRKKEEYNRGI